MRLFTCCALAVACLPTFLASVPAAAAEAIRVMSFNIRYGTANDGVNAWPERKDLLADSILRFDPDLLGTQETLLFQRDELLGLLHRYEAAGVGRDDGAEKGEMAALFFKPARFEKLDGGTFWLSSTPETVGSKGWDAALPRVATWVKLVDKADRAASPILFLNTHFDHQGAVARRESAALIRRWLAEHGNGCRLVVTGDFNAGEATPPYEALFGDDAGASPLVDTFRVAVPERDASGPEGTFTGFDATNTGGERIDWIGCSGDFRVEAAGIDRCERAGRTPSDHAAVTAVLQTPAGPASTRTADERLAEFFRDHLQESFRLRPLEASALGDHAYDHLLDDISPEARAGWLEHWKRQLAALEERFGGEALERLSVDGRIDFEILRDDLVRSIWLAENERPFEQDARVYGGYTTDSVYALLTQSTLPREKNLENAIARMKLIPAVVDAARVSLVDPTPTMLETAIGQNRGSIAFYSGDLFSLASDSPQLPALREAAKPVVAALERHQAFLEKELLPRARGEWRLGREKFSRKLELVLDMGWDAERVVTEARAEFERVHRDLVAVSRQLWYEHFPGKPLPPEDAAGKRELVRLVIGAVNRDHGAPETLVLDARETVAGLKTFIRTADIVGLPEPDRCRILEMPEFRRGNSAAYLENALPLDPEGPSTYAISPPPASWDESRRESFLEEYNRRMLEILTIHEAYPGHYVQLEWSNRCPSLVRRILQSGTYIEGWAVYTEQMMLDQGYGGGDPALRLMQLKFYLRAVCNALLDHGMHCEAWSDEKALAFLIDDAFQTEGEARPKIVRAKQSSVQLSTYFAGRTAHHRLRQEIQREQGEAFELGRYHEAVLSCGSVPVKHLPTLVRQRLKSPR
jgi:endonuclease/exonuclease/phosphatase family metal-dependent hydrolase